MKTIKIIVAKRLACVKTYFAVNLTDLQNEILGKSRV